MGENISSINIYNKKDNEKIENILRKKKKWHFPTGCVIYWRTKCSIDSLLNALMEKVSACVAEPSAVEGLH